MKILFCSEPFSPAKVDELYAEEMQAAQAAGFECALIDLETLREGNANQATKRVQAQSERTQTLYRGWMMTPAHYTQLYRTLERKNILLINSPDGYKHAHYFPEAYPILEGNTPKSIWLKKDGEFSMERLLQAVTVFGDAPLMVKDYVKSRKHDWETACYIPSAADAEKVAQVVQTFIDLQGEDLNEGIVIREFIELESLAVHPKSGMPLSKEFRLFFFEHQLLHAAPYWEEGEYQKELPPPNLFLDIAVRIQSRFFTMDVAKTKRGEWVIVELGDGQVAGLPERVDATAFYSALFQAIHTK